MSNGGLSGAIHNALTGMNAAGQRIGVISNNIVNASTENYTAKKVDLTTVEFGGVGSGVQAGIAYRNVNEALIEDIRAQTGQVSFSGRLDEVYTSVQQHFGAPGDHKSLGNQVRNFTNALSSIATSPNSSVKQSDVINAGKNLISEVSSLGTNIQNLRATSDQNIAQAISKVNGALSTINVLNNEIIKNQASGMPIGDYEDQRDQALKSLSECLNVRVRPQSSNFSTPSGGGAIEVTMENGATLVQSGAVNLFSFQASSGMNATVTTPAAIFLNGQDISRQLSGGTIGADIKARDVILPNLQNDLDNFTTQLRDTVNSVHNLGSGFPPAQALTGQRTFTGGGTTSFQGTGTVRVALVDLNSGNYIESQDYNLSSASTLNDVTANLSNTGTSGHIRVQLNSNQQLTVSSTLPNVGVVVSSVGADAQESITGQGLGFSHYFGLNDFFVTPSSVVQGGGSIAGMTNQLGIRQDIIMNPSLLSRGKLDTTLNTVGSPALSQGDRSIVQNMATALNGNASFGSSGNLTARSTTFVSYANDIIATNASSASNNAKDFANKKELLDVSNKRSSDISGVNLQQEVTDLMMVQKLFLSSSRVTKAIDTCFDTLLKIT